MGVTFINGIPYGDATTDVVKIKKADWEKIPTRFSDNIIYDIEDMTINEQLIKDDVVSQELTWSSYQINQGLMNLIEIKEVTKTTASDGMIWSIPVVDGKRPYMAVVTSSYTYNLKCDVIKAGTQNAYGLKVFYWLNGYNALDSQSVTVKILYA